MPPPGTPHVHSQASCPPVPTGARVPSSPLVKALKYLQVKAPENTQRPINGEWINKMWYAHAAKYSPARKRTNSCLTDQ